MLTEIAYVNGFSLVVSLMIILFAEHDHISNFDLFIRLMSPIAVISMVYAYAVRDRPYPGYYLNQLNHQPCMYDKPTLGG